MKVSEVLQMLQDDCTCQAEAVRDTGKVEGGAGRRPQKASPGRDGAAFGRASRWPPKQSCAPARGQGQGVVGLGALRTERDLRSRRFFSQLSAPAMALPQIVPRGPGPLFEIRARIMLSMAAECPEARRWRAAPGHRRARFRGGRRGLSPIASAPRGARRRWPGAARGPCS
jgi:hypothetical protein